jgi:hypothetical protein
LYQYINHWLFLRFNAVMGPEVLFCSDSLL